ncbi:hypothetical protein EC9_22930 [Rosistilla ulvae]|uniref:Uncharacterized protein n=2 Tax=Rosistilla ulvae TaxID=1930277 RepID=A0A517LZQ5_9BACT|nr:hypothetical protein EC9_22930 [Rosistilla ulvae]
MDQYFIQQKYRLSAEMHLAVCYIAQDHVFRGFVQCRTLKAIRRRRLVDKDNELTSLGWTYYLELTEAGPCPTNGLKGYRAKDPQLLYLNAQQRLEAVAKANAESGQQQSLVKAGVIAKVKYGGRQITLDDGTRWEVDDVDCRTADIWMEMDRVVIVDGEMFKPDESKRVGVEEDSHD